jgi:hypothetical protein
LFGHEGVGAPATAQEDLPHGFVEWKTKPREQLKQHAGDLHKFLVIGMLAVEKPGVLQLQLGALSLQFRDFAGNVDVDGGQLAQSCAKTLGFSLVLLGLCLEMLTCCLPGLGQLPLESSGSGLQTDPVLGDYGGQLSLQLV